MVYRQHPPNAVQIEPTEGCNLRCGFCGIRAIRDQGPRGALSGPYEFMTVDTATTLARQILRLGWKSRLEFAMHGEPTVNPDLPAIAAAFKSRLPHHSLLLTTNGIPMLEGAWGTRSLREAIFEMFAAGVNTIAVDDYKPHRVAPEIRRLKLPVPVIEYPADRGGNPHVRHPGHRVVIVQDIAEASAGTHSYLNNHSGCAAPKDHSFNDRTCTLPFRELSVRWDGRIALCCNDWRGEYHLGHCIDLDGAWHSAAAYAARRILLNEGRGTIPVCNGCTYRPTRPGLLPDPAGKQRAELGQPTPADHEVVAAASGEGAWAPVVLRRWETGFSGGRTRLRVLDGGVA